MAMLRKAAIRRSCFSGKAFHINIFKERRGANTNQQRRGHYQNKWRAFVGNASLMDTPYFVPP
jgi:hypothetical protein